MISQGYTTVDDAMNVADNTGIQQYWMDYRIIYIDGYGAYNYVLSQNQDWQSEFNRNNLQVVAYRTRDNRAPTGFSNWQWVQ